jgi:hypothetical protein
MRRETFRKRAVDLIGPATAMLDNLIGDIGHSMSLTMTISAFAISRVPSAYSTRSAWNAAATPPPVAAKCKLSIGEYL